MPGTRAFDDVKDQVKARVNLVDLVGQHVRLRRQGREYTGLCPFHQEKTPSFWVNEQTQAWYCFGCQKGGDVFSFQQEIEKTDFRGALQTLAEMAGVELVEQSGADRERTALRRRIIDMNRLAVQYYEYVLWSTPAGEPGRDLLQRREVAEEVARRFGLGYAPSGHSFVAFLKKRGRSIADAVAAGLVRRDGTDFFSERVLIPIRDERGQPLAFTGRTVRADEKVKYMNTAETPAYHKGRVLFALDLAREGIQQTGQSVLMEGQFDVIVAHVHGATNAIAASGTALTEDQVRLLKRFTKEEVLVFDSDNAGKAAAFRAIEQAAAGGLRTRVGVLEGDAKDPDEFLRAGGDWEAVLRAAQPGWEFWIRDSIRDLNTRRPDQLELALGRVETILAKVGDPVVREQYRQLLPTWIDADPALLMGRLRRVRPARSGEPAPGPAAAAANGPTPGKQLSPQLGYLLSILAVRPDSAPRVAAALPEADLEDDERGPFQRMVETLGRGGLQALTESLPSFPDTEQDLVRRAWAHPPPSVDDATVDQVVRRIRAQAGRRRRSAIISALRDAEARGDREQVSALEARLLELNREGKGN